MKKLIILFALGFITLFTHVEKASACSGGGTTTSLRQKIIDTEVIVYGTFVEVDDANLNGIFKVDYYLKGNIEQEYLLLALNYIRWIRDLESRMQLGGECSRLTGEINIDTPMIFFLQKQNDGSYRRISSYAFSDMDSLSNIFFDQKLNRVELSEDKFLAFTYETTRQKNSPSASVQHPWKAPVLLQTDTNQQYIAPVDGTTPIEITDEEAFKLKYDQYECASPPCTVFTPDSLNTIHLIPENYEGEREGYPYVYHVVGEKILVSPTNDWFALWNGNQLEIYALFYDRAGNGNPDTPLLIQSVETMSPVLSHATWSQDGRILAYSDAAGLWIWDISVPEAQPNLLLPSSGSKIPLARYFSPQGHYLAAEQDGELFTMNLDTNERFTDGLISPDDRYLLAHIYPGASLELQGLLAVRTTETYERHLPIEQWQWHDESHFFVSGCKRGYFTEVAFVDEPLCSTYLVNVVSLLEDESWVTLGSGYSAMFDYDSQNDQMLRLIGEQQIEVNRQEYDYTGLIEGNIISAEWLPSLFYHDD